MEKITVKAITENLDIVNEMIDRVLEENECPVKVQMQIDVAVEEVYVNIAHYAYGGKPGEAIVGMEIEQEPRAIKLVFKDRGLPYNPLEKEVPDITLSAEERGIGGLGIFMVKNTMDKVEYEYSGGQNILSMEKAF